MFERKVVNVALTEQLYWPAKCNWTALGGASCTTQGNVKAYTSANTGVMNDDFASSDLGAFFAEVDRLQASKAPQKLSAVASEPAAQYLSRAAVAVTPQDQSGTPTLLRVDSAPHITPRSSKEIRGIFSKRLTHEPQASPKQQNAASGQHVYPTSRFQVQATVHNRATSTDHQPVNVVSTSTAASNAASFHLELAAAPSSAGQPSFDQFAYQQPVPAEPSLCLMNSRTNQPAPMQHHTGHIGAQQYASQPSSHSGQMRNSVASSVGSGSMPNKLHSSQQGVPPARNSTASNAPAVPVRAEINVGECATVEVNFRPHDNIIRVIKRQELLTDLQML